MQKLVVLFWSNLVFGFNFTEDSWMNIVGKRLLLVAVKPTDPSGLQEFLPLQSVKTGSEVDPHSIAVDIMSLSPCGKAAGV